MKWTNEDENTLEDLWFWGHSSSVISQNLGNRTRNAVMGKVNKLRLIGRQGERIGCARKNPDKFFHQASAEDFIENITNEKYDWADPVHRSAIVHLACLLVGRFVEPVSQALQKPAKEIEEVLYQMQASGAWKENDSPPAKWWHPREGNMAFLLDAMTTAGLAAFKQEGSERKYFKTEEGSPRDQRVS